MRSQLPGPDDSGASFFRRLSGRLPVWGLWRRLRMQPWPSGYDFQLLFRLHYRYRMTVCMREVYPNAPLVLVAAEVRDDFLCGPVVYLGPPICRRGGSPSPATNG